MTLTNKQSALLAGASLSASALLVAPQVASASTVACTPWDVSNGLSSVRSGEDKVAPEVTQFLTEDRTSYRVTQCDSSGAPVRETTVTALDMGDGSKLEVPIAIRTPGVSEFSTWPNPSLDSKAAAKIRAGAAETAKLVPPPTNGILGPPLEPTAQSFSPIGGPLAGELSKFRGRVRATAAIADNSCTWGGYGTFAVHTGRSYTYYINGDSFGNNNDTTVAIAGANTAWNNTLNNCSFGDQDNWTGTYGGIKNVAANANDGVSLYEKASLSGFCSNPNALACNRVLINGSGQIYEDDIRFSTGYTWTNNGASGAYDYAAVASHETGHTLGLSDLTGENNEWMTMYGSANPNEIRKRDLARGDILGMRASYPG